MNATIKNGKLVIEIDLVTPYPSTSGKTLLVATTHGFQGTTATVNNKPISISLSATIKP